MENSALDFETAPPRIELLESSCASYGPTILVAEDAADTRLILSRTLEFENYRCIQAVDGEDAIEKALQLRPDLILLDLKLPKLNGFQVMMRLKNLGLKSKFCIISAVDKEDFIRRALDFGASDYIVKPVVPDIVAHKVRGIFRIPDSSIYFQLPCSLSTRISEESRTYDGQVHSVSEMGLVLRTEVRCQKGDVLSLGCPTLARIMQREIPLIARVKEVHGHRWHGARFDVEVEFVGLSEVQRQRLRAEVIRGRFLVDSAHLN